VIRVEAASRLHFGLLSLPGPGPEAAIWLDSEGQHSIAARHFGGVGLMVEHPGIALTVAPAADWSAHGPCADRALAFAKAASAGLGIHQAFQINVERCPPEHIGLGTGTQLGLAVARAIALVGGRRDMAAAELAKLIGRGRRSALGIHGFTHGGFLVEAGKRDPDAISPLVAHVAFPPEWSILLVMPRGLQGTHGQCEAEAFGQLGRSPPNLAQTESLCRLVLLGMLPALMERDLEGFGNALYDFNRRVGNMFKPWQGDVYGHPIVGEVIRGLRSAGLKSVGQSSWGPTVFAIVDRQDASDVCEWLIRKHGLDREELVVTRAASGEPGA
jgi:beta-ribofuranosylaminobenzene 5'-phosphate synthase